MLKLDQVPLVEGGWQGWAYLFEPKDQPKEYAPKPRADQFVDDSDSIPF